MPSVVEIESNFDNIVITQTDIIKDGIAAMDSGEYAVVILTNKPSKTVRAKLERSLRYLNHKPSLIILLRKGINPIKDESLLNESTFYVAVDENLDESLIWAIDGGLKRHKLHSELSHLQRQIERTPHNQNIVDLALSYNHEINNLLTSVLGNMELVLKSSKKFDKSLEVKLKKIEGDTQKIQRLALNFVDNISVAPQPGAWDIQAPQII